MNRFQAALVATIATATLASAMWPFGGRNAAKSEFVFAENGQAKAMIVVDPSAPRGYRYAANECADYLAKLTGARFMVTAKPVAGMNTIYIGSNRDKPRPFEETEITVDNAETMRIEGQGPRGTLYAVYELLEQMGVGFYMWDYDYLPPVTNRLALTTGYHLQSAPWMVCRKSWSGPTWGGDEQAFRYQMRLRYHNSENTKRFWATYGMGQAGSFSNAPSYSIAQTLCAYFIPRKRFFDQKKNPKEYHPEWYAWHEEGKKRHGHFLCVSNPKMFEELCREVEAEIVKETARRPGERIEIGLGLDDGSVRCDCRDCMKLSEGVPNRGLAAAAVQYISLINRVAKRFAEKYPLVRFNILSYDGFGPTPENVERFPMEPNAGVGIALLWRNFGRPIAGCERTPLSVENWNRISSNGIANWDYYANFATWYIPFPNLDTMGENWRYYKAHNINRMDSQNQWSILGDLADLHFWLYSKLSWNPDADDRALIEKFCRDCYGAAAPKILEYIDFLHHCRDRQRGLWTGCYALSTEHYLSGADCVRILRLFNEAQAAVKNDPARLRNVTRAKFGVLALTGMRYNDMIAPAKAMRFFLQPREKYLREFYDTGLRNDVGNGALWAGESQSFDSLQALFKGEMNPTAAPQQAKSRYISGDELEGGKKMVKSKDADGTTIAQVEMRNPTEQLYSIFMCDGNRDVSYKFKEGDFGSWYVFATLRIDSAVESDPAAAYFSYRQPFENDVKSFGHEEMVSLFISESKSDKGWKIVSFGKYPFHKGAVLYMFPGVVHPLNSFAVKNFTLVNASVLDDEKNVARYLGIQPPRGRDKLPSKSPIVSSDGLELQKERFDGFWFARAGDGKSVGRNARVVATIGKEQAGEKYLFARVRIGSKRYLATDVARLSLYTAPKQVPSIPDESIAPAVVDSVKVGGSPYDDSWQLISLGKRRLEAGMTVALELAPGADARFLDMRNLFLIEPELMESSVK